MRKMPRVEIVKTGGNFEVVFDDDMNIIALISIGNDRKGQCVHLEYGFVLVI